MDKKQDLWTSAPEVVPSKGNGFDNFSEKGDHVSTEKERAVDEGMQVLPASAPEMIYENESPQAIDEESGKEVVSTNPSLSTPEKYDKLPARPRKRRRTIFWWTVGLVVIALAIGLGVGFGVASKDHKSSSTISSNSSAAVYDAVAVSTSIGAGPPTGTYDLRISAAEKTQAACLPQQSQKAAWACNSNVPMQLGVATEKSVGDSASEARVFSNGNNAAVQYGPQPFSMNITDSKFLPVTDNEHPDYGTALYFANTYNKIVVVPESKLSTSSKRRRRSQVLQKRQSLTVGDQPWFCFFNQTLLEGFIYINQAASPAASITTPTESASQIIVSPTSTTNQISSTITDTTTSTATTTATTTSLPSSVLFPDTTSPTTIPSSSTSTSLPAFPYKFKLREHRTSPNSAQPYCQQYQILESGEADWIADADGNPIIIHLEESDPAAQSDASDAGCFCEWMSG